VALSRREMIEAGLSGFALTLVAPTAVHAKTGSKAARSKSIKPGEVWTDTTGKPIQAHAGGVIHVDGVFYWYGENKEFTTGTGKPESWGIRLYRS